MFLVGLVACASAGSPLQGQPDGNAGDPDGSDMRRIDGSNDNMTDGSAQPTDGTTASGTHLVINEVDYDQVGTDTAEFVEILNPTSGSISLSNITVMFVNGANNTVYASVDLTPEGSLAAGGYLVLGNSSVGIASSAKAMDPGWTSNAIQNGNPDGLALVDTSAKTVIDALSYGGSITTAQLTGFGSPVSLVEGTATSMTDSNTNVGSLCRRPNGQDTDNASVDWSFCTTLTPGTANP